MILVIIEQSKINTLSPVAANYPAAQETDHNMRHTSPSEWELFALCSKRHVVNSRIFNGTANVFLACCWCFLNYWHRVLFFVSCCCCSNSYRCVPSNWLYSNLALLLTLSSKRNRLILVGSIAVIWVGLAGLLKRCVVTSDVRWTGVLWSSISFNPIRVEAAPPSRSQLCQNYFDLTWQFSFFSFQGRRIIAEYAIHSVLLHDFCDRARINTIRSCLMGLLI